MFAMNQISGHDQSRDIQYIQSIQKNVQPIWKNGDEKENNTITDGGVAPRCSFAGPT